MNPKDVVETTELDRDYVKALVLARSGSDFVKFFKHWRYWMEPEIFMRCRTWSILQHRLQEAQHIFAGAPVPVRRDSIAVKLLAPRRIRDVAVMKMAFDVPWGAAYLHLREHNMIDY